MTQPGIACILRGHGPKRVFSTRELEFASGVVVSSKYIRATDAALVVADGTDLVIKLTVTES